MNKKSRFEVNPQLHTVSFISEGEVIKNPAKLIESTQKFYKSIALTAILPNSHIYVYGAGR